MAPSVRAALGGSNSSRACGMGCVAAACARPTINAFRAVGERPAALAPRLAKAPSKHEVVLLVRSAAPEDVAAGRRGQ